MSTPKPFTVGLVQMTMSDDTDANLDRAVQHVRSAVEQGAQVVCLPELFCSRYFCQVEDAALFDLAEPIDGPTARAMGEVAREHRIAIVASIFEKRAPGVYHNTAIVLDPAGEIAGVYRKMHIPDDPAFYEKFYFAPGDLGFLSVPTEFGRLGVLVCWDQWYPEAARLTAMRGAEILFYPTAIGWHPAEKDSLGAEQRDAWRTVQRAHAVANGVYVAAVNRVGHEPCPDGRGAGIEFWGTTFLAGPFGKVLAEAPTDAEAVLVHEVDPAQIEATRRGWPFLRDRRIDAYEGLTRRLLDEPQP